MEYILEIEGEAYVSLGECPPGHFIHDEKLYLKSNKKTQ